MADREGQVQNGEIAYKAWDCAEARGTVVLSHGYAEHSGRYEHVAAALVSRGFAVWAPDHRGHGLSAGDRGDVVSFTSVVADLDEVVELARSSAPDLPLLLVGHSLGGAIAIAYALEHQEKLAALSLSAPAIEFGPELLALATLPEIPPLPLADVVSRDPAVVEAYKSDPLVYQGPPPPNVLVLMGSMQELIARLGELTLPVQIMQGSDDALVIRQAFRDVACGVSSADVTARLWPGLFHEIFNEATDGAVVGALADWLVAQAG